MKKRSAAQIARERDEDRFMAEFATNGGNATQAALVVWPNLTYEAARKKGSKVTNDEVVRERFRKRMAKQTTREIMSIQERQEFLSEVARGVHKATMKDRISAVKVLNQMDAIGGPTMNINVSVEDKRKMVASRIDELLGIETSEEDGVITIECVESGTTADSGSAEVSDTVPEAAEVD